MIAPMKKVIWIFCLKQRKNVVKMCRYVNRGDLFCVILYVLYSTSRNGVYIREALLHISYLRQNPF